MHFTDSDYRRYIMMSHRHHLLVEGKDDKRSFRVLFDEIFRSNSPVDVQSAHDFPNKNGLGNREFVEAIADGISDREYANRFAAFVDREFRGFSVGNTITDEIRGHFVDRRLVWSRGHSIENYLFDFRTMIQTLRAFCTSEHYQGALDSLEDVFDDTVRVASAITLASVTLQQSGVTSALDILKNAVDSQCLSVIGKRVIVNYTVLEELLRTRMKLDTTRAAQAIESLQKWQRVVEDLPFEDARWFCHGHIGLAIIWATFGACLFGAAQAAGCDRPKDEARKATQAAEAVRFNACLDSWCRRVVLGESEYPSVLLGLLALEACTPITGVSS